MKKLLFVVLSLIFIVCACFAAACKKKPTPVMPTDSTMREVPDAPAAPAEKMTLSVSVKTLTVGETFTIKVTGTNGIAPSFASENESVVTVKQTGSVTAVGAGNAAVTVTAGAQSKNCYFTVEEDTRIPVLKINNVVTENGGNVLPMGVGESYALDAEIVFGGSAAEGEISYRSSDTSVASVDENGVVTAGSSKGTAVVEVSALYKGRFAGEIRAEIKVVVSDVFWSFSLDGYDKLYAVSSFGGKNYKNTARFSAKLKAGGAEYGLDQLEVTAGEGGYVEIDGDVITAKRAGQTFIKLRYTSGTETYENLQRINVERIVDDRTSLPATTFVRKDDPSMEAFGAIFGGLVDKVIDVTDSAERPITVELGRYEGLKVGDRRVDIYTDAFVVKLNLHVVDHLIMNAAQFKAVLYDALDEYIELGADIYGVGEYKRQNKEIFTGTLDGKGHTVSGIDFVENTALFPVCGCTIKNIAIVDVTMENMSGVLTQNSYGSGIYVDNVYIRVKSCSPNENYACGGLLYQIGNSKPDINNVIVEMYGINGVNAGVIAGIWWGSSIALNNCYFFTDGNPYGIKHGTNPDDPYQNNDYGMEINESYATGGINYVFTGAEAFRTARDANAVDLSRFDESIWDLEADIPRFRTDNGNDFGNAAETSVTAVDGGEYEFSRLIEEGERYTLKLPEISTVITEVYAAGMPINDFAFDPASRVLSLPSGDILKLAVSSVNLVVKTAGGYYKATVGFEIIDLNAKYGILYGGLGAFEIYSEEQTQKIYLPVDVGSAYNFVLHYTEYGHHQALSIERYDSEDRSLVFTTAEVRKVWYTGAFDMTFTSSIGECKGSVTICKNVLRTAGDIAEKFSSGSGTFALGADIDGATITNLNDVTEWSDKIRLFGMGHSLTGLTVKGNGIFGEQASGYVRDIIITVKSVELKDGDAGVLGGIISNMTFENVYIEAVCDKLFDTCLGNVEIISSVFNVTGEVINYHHENPAVHTLPDQLGGVLIAGEDFFTVYEAGLPEGFGKSGFTLKADGLYLFGKRVMEK